MHSTKKRYTVGEALGTTASHEVTLIIRREDGRETIEAMMADAAIRKLFALVQLTPQNVREGILNVGPKSVRWSNGRWWLYSHPHGIHTQGFFGRTIELTTDKGVLQ